jgi:hypothetical protein
MKQLRCWGFLPAFCLLALPVFGQSQSRNQLALGTTGLAKFGSVADVPLRISTTDQVQGLVAAFEWDGTKGTGTGLTLGPLIDTPAKANTVVSRVGTNFVVLGVVMDSDGTGGEVINPGNNQLLATAQIRCAADPNPGTPGDQVLTPVTFADGKFATVAGGPLLDNIVVVGGLSVGGTEGLILTAGSFNCVEGFNRFTIAPGATNDPAACGDAKVLLDNLGPVEGYVVALCHDPAKLTLNSIAVGAAATAQAADFSASDILPAGGTLGVVIDLVAPFTNNTIPIGEGNHIATYRYCCVNVPVSGPPVCTDLHFCDNQLGSPVKENVVVIGGLSVNPSLEDGQFCCQPVGVAVENCTNGIDDDGDQLIDGADPDCQQLFTCGSRSQDSQINGSIGSSTEVCFFIRSPEDNKPGHAQFDHIQGFSMALSFCCDLVRVSSEVLDISGTIVEAIGAEFVSVQADNDPNDGDGCELIIGVLVDALPPFDGQTIPPLPTLQRVGCVKFDIVDSAANCGQCCDIKFTDGLNGRGKVPIKNLISVENVSRGPQTKPCKICIVDKERFFRGDCNFSRMGSMSVDIADAAAVVSFLFLPGTWKFQPPCLDACDCNDDGRVDLADAVCILQFLFQGGNFPPAPGPGLELTTDPNPNMVRPSPAGTDDTPDKLDCKGGGGCPGA